MAESSGPQSCSPTAFEEGAAVVFEGGLEAAVFEGGKEAVVFEGREEAVDRVVAASEQGCGGEAGAPREMTLLKAGKKDAGPS